MLSSKLLHFFSCILFFSKVLAKNVIHVMINKMIEMHIYIYIYIYNHMTEWTAICLYMRRIAFRFLFIFMVSVGFCVKFLD
jgi:hypothetical protein